MAEKKKETFVKKLFSKPKGKTATAKKPKQVKSEKKLTAEGWIRRIMKKMGKGRPGKF